MMRLLSAPASPFVRKVAMTARIKSLIDQITIEHADTRSHNATLAAANPLSKIPALVLADGTQLYDSRVICEYLDTLAPAPVLFPPAGIERFGCLTRGSLADGIMDAAILIVYEERYRPAGKRVPEWLARQQSKIDGGLSAFEANPPSGPLDYSHIALASALGYLDLRFGDAWRHSHPALSVWLTSFATLNPAFNETTPVG